MENIRTADIKLICNAMKLNIVSGTKKKEMIDMIKKVDINELRVKQLNIIMDIINASKDGDKNELVSRYTEWLSKIDTSHKRKSIPKALRDKVFSTYCSSYDNATCMVGCGEKITPFNFECGHVISVANGGGNTIENLRPICSRCNRSMGTENMDEFIKNCGFNSKPLEEQPPQPQSVAPESDINGAKTITLRKFNYVSVQTISGSELYKYEQELLKKSFNATDDETIELLYVCTINLEDFTFANNTVVGITNNRIFKTEKGNTCFTMLSDIKSMAHEKNGIFRWDKLLLTLKDGSVVGYGIYYADTIKYFMKYLTPKVNCQ